MDEECESLSNSKSSVSGCCLAFGSFFLPILAWRISVAYKKACTIFKEHFRKTEPDFSSTFSLFKNVFVSYQINICLIINS